MTVGNFGFHFEEARRGATQGAISPAEQFFEGSRAEESLMRETGQNSIDARLGAEPVRMVFELTTMNTAAIPGIEGLRSHIAQVEEQTRKSQGHASMLLAHKTAHEQTIQVLRIGDYGTKGLAGSESTDDPKSPLSALTRGAGISADDGSRGGSFGIGSAVGPMASDMNTVLYTSLPVGSNDVVFAGYSCLATHRDLAGIWRAGDGFFTDLDDSEDFKYLRNPGSLGPFAERDEPGTDLFVLGYRKAETDPSLQHLKVAAMKNFFLAIDRGELIVEGRSPSGGWRLDSDSLKTHIEEDPEAAAFYRAIKDPTPFVGENEELGKITLYINVDDTLERSLHTITVRKPLMRIETFRHTSIPVKYAAVLECSDDKGNTLLRQLEPPQHHKWDAGRAVGGAKLLAGLKSFVREGLKDRVKHQIGEQVQVKGLSKYLPAELFEDTSVEPPTTFGTPEVGQGQDQESSTVRGAERRERQILNRERKSVPVSVQTNARDKGTSPTETGKNTGGTKKRSEKGGGLPGMGERGEGTARITEEDLLRFRSWSDAATGELCVALTSVQDISGRLELIALGPGGTVEEKYVLPILSGSLRSGDHSAPLEFENNVLSNINLKAGVPSQVRLKLSSNHRYRLGVK